MNSGEKLKRLDLLQGGESIISDESIDKNDPHNRELIGKVLFNLGSFASETFVLKISNFVLSNEEYLDYITQDIAILRKAGINIVVVHDGLKQANAFLDRLKIKQKYVEKMQVIDQQAVEGIEMYLSGHINKNIVRKISYNGCQAVGLSGKDCNFITAKKHKSITKDSVSNIEKILDVGFAGEIERLNTDILYTLEEMGVVAVISPIGFSDKNATYYINSTAVAVSIAQELSAARLIITSETGDLGDLKGQLLIASEGENALKNAQLSEELSNDLRFAFKAVSVGTKQVDFIKGDEKHELLGMLFFEELIGVKVQP